MRVTYSATEARTRFSEVMRRVRNGDTVVVTYRGEPVAEIRPLERRGVIMGVPEKRTPFKIGKRVPGALERFLVERGRPWES